MKNCLIVFCLLMFSCSNKGEVSTPANSEEVHKEDSISNSTDSSKQVLEDTVIIDKKLSFPEKANAFTLKYKRWYNESGPAKSILPDRFSTDTVIRLALTGNRAVLYGENEVYPTAQLYFYSYSDTISFNNALHNWMNCFGSDCTVIREGEDVKSIKTTPSFTLYGFPEIVHLSWLCEHDANNWDVWIQELKILFGKGKKEISVKCGGPLRWK